MRTQDERAFVEYVSASARALRRTAYLMTGDWQSAEDALQGALVKLYAAWPRLDREHGIHAYARRAVVTTVLDEGRRPWRREHATGTTHLSESVGRDEMRAVEDRMMIIAALAELPPRQRATVVLRYYDDLTVDETARALGCSVGTVKSQTARGLDALRARLVDAGAYDSITVGDDA